MTEVIKKDAEFFDVPFIRKIRMKRQFNALLIAPYRRSFVTVGR